MYSSQYLINRYTKSPSSSLFLTVRMDRPAITFTEEEGSQKFTIGCGACPYFRLNHNMDLCKWN